MNSHLTFITGEGAWFGERSDRVLIIGNDQLGAKVAEKLFLTGFDVTLAGAAANGAVRALPMAQPISIKGFVDRFEVEFTSDKGRFTERFGRIVNACGAQLKSKASEVGLVDSTKSPESLPMEEQRTELGGQLDQVITLSRFEELLKNGYAPHPDFGKWFHVSFLCGLSGESDPSTFSQVLNCVEKLASFDRVQPYVFTKNLKVAASGLERRYRTSRQSGALFFKFDDEGPEFQLTEAGWTILFTDPLLNLDMELKSNLIIVDEHKTPYYQPAVSAAIQSSPAYQPFSSPDSMRFPGVLTPKAGIYAVGSSRGVYDEDLINTDIDSLITALQMGGAGGTQQPSAFVDEFKCAICLTCLRMCPHGAIGFGTKAIIDPQSCQSCGICIAECPMKAIQFESPALTLGGQIEAALAGRGAKTVAAFLCAKSAAEVYSQIAADLPDYVAPVIVNCAGSVGPEEILKALTCGAAAVLVAGCYKGNCASIYGTTLAEERIKSLNSTLTDAGIDPEKVQLVRVAANTNDRLKQAILELCGQC